MKTVEESSRWDVLWVNAHLATFGPEAGAPEGGMGYGEILHGALGTKEGRITWIGPQSDLPAEPQQCAQVVRDAEGAWITPGLVDCHTHLVFAGDRSGEFERRLQGVTYEEIAREGGGIRSTVAATRGASEAELVQGASRRLADFLNEGVTTIEVKSGYGLEVETELKMLRVARRLEDLHPIQIRTTLLGAHALPPECDDRREEYVRLVCEEMIPRAAEEGLADAVDAFCEGIGFDRSECEQVFRAAKASGLPVKLHADQLSDLSGASLAAEMGALSADHLEYTSRQGAEAMAEAGTVAVLLPGAFYYLREKRLPPIELFREHGVPMAVATDCNPGSSPITSVLFTLNLACTIFRLTPEEALTGVTRNGARALGLLEDRGTLEVGKRADLALWYVGHPRELCYWIGPNPLREVVWGGKSTSLPD